MLNFLKDQLNDLAQKYIEKPNHQLVTLDIVRSALKSNQEDQSSLNKLFFDLIEEEQIKSLNNFENDQLQSDGKQKSELEFGEKSLKIFQQTKLRMSKEQEQEKVQEEKEKQLREVLHTINKQYLSENTKENELIILEFNSFPKYALVDDVQKRHDSLTNMSNVLGQKLNENCMKHYDNIEQGFKLIDQIYKVNSQQIIHIQKSRGTLAHAKQHLVNQTKHIIQLKQRIKRVSEVLEQLNVMQQKFGELNNKIKDIDNEDCLQDAHTVIPKLNQAKQQIMEDKISGQEGADLLQKYKCLENIENFIENKIELFKKYILQSADKIIFNYNPNKYFVIMHSYFYLQKHFYQEIKPFSELFTSNVHNYIDSITKQAFDQFKEEVGFYISEYDERRFNISALLPQIQKEQFLVFLRILLHKCCEFMSNYSNCLSFHLQLNPDSNYDILNKVHPDEKQEFLDFLDSIQQLYISNKDPYWKHIQRKIGLIIQSSNQILTFSSQSMRSFLEYMNIFMGIGESFSNSSSIQIQNFISDKCEAYIEHYHKISEVSVISSLQGENWKRLPIAQNITHEFIEKGEVKSIHRILRIMKTYSFKPLDLNDNIKDVFEFNLNTFKTDNPFQVEIKKEVVDPTNKFRSSSYFRKFNKKYNIMNQNDSKEQNNTQQQNKDNNSVENNQHIKELFMQQKYNKSQVVISSSSQKIINQFGDYLELIDMVRPSTPQIVNCLKSNIIFFIYYIVNSFLDTSTQAQLMEKLIVQGVSKLEDANQLDNNIQKFSQVVNSFKLQKNHKNLAKIYLENNISCHQTIKKLIPPSQLSNKSYKGISERIIAIESFDYLLFNYKQLIPIIQYMYGQELDCFELSVFENARDELKSLIFLDYAPQYARSDQIFSNIPNSKWKLNSNTELVAINNYVERFCQVVADYKEQLSSTGGGSIPLQVQQDIFCLLIDFCYSQLVESYSKILKINDLGRQQMQRDFQTIQKCVANLIKDQPREQLLRAFVEDYLNICQSNDLDELHGFIAFNKERYTLETLVGLARTSVIGSNMMANKQKELIITILNDYKKYFIENNITVPF